MSAREHDHVHDAHGDMVDVSSVFKDGINGLLYCQLVELNSGQNDQDNRDITEVRKYSFM